ncbi:MAG TPA: CHAT domain-containing protein [Myxococcaceae bacterium]|nr:CHAT domain-containing protein [Myxococcaceae bacterium]
MTPEDHSGGPVRCDQLGLFVDGELPSDEAAAFRKHLLACPRCQQEMHGLMQLSALAEQARVQRPAEPPAIAPVIAALDRRARPRRAAWMGVVGAVAIAAALVLALRVNASRSDLPTMLASLDARRTSGWPSYAGPREYRPYVVQRGTAAPAPLKGLARLEEEGNWQALGTAALVRGEYAQALTYLRRAPRNVRTLNDLGLALMDSGSLDGALEAFDQARELDPTFPPVEFNRALVLDRLKLPRAALETIRKAAQGAAGGWKDEAVKLTSSLQSGVDDRAAESRRVEEAMQALLDGRLPDPSLVSAFPGVFRSQLYRALALAPDRAAVEKLLPLARQLDGISGSPRLEHWVTATAARASPRRAQLAARLRPLLTSSTLDQRAPLAAEARAAGQDDQLLFVLSRDFHSREENPAYAELVQRVRDPFWDVRLAGYRVWAERRAGRLIAAERIARSVLEETCRDSTLAGVCADAAFELAYTYAHAGRPADAQGAFEKYRRLAARAPLGRDQYVLLLAGATSADADRVALARAEFEEAGHLPSDSCDAGQVGRVSLAQAYLRRGDAGSARAVLEAPPRCEGWDLAVKAEVYTDLAVLTGTAQDRTAAAERIAKASAAATAPVDRLVVESLQLMLDAEEGRPGTRQRLEELQRRAKDVAGAEDQVSRAGRTVALQLIRESKHREALEVAASMLETSAPARCALAVVADNRRVGLAWTTGESGAQGQVRRRSDPGAPAGDPNCATLVVLAPTGLLDLARWLPADQAWSIRVGAPAQAGPVRFGDRLLVRGALAPGDLNLPPLRREGAVPQGWKVVEGADATPSRVQQALVTADLIDFEVHGLVDASAPDGAVLVLSPDAQGTYSISATDIRGLRLERGPVVLLGACRSATGSHYRDATWTLPQAFVRAGARAVYASMAELPDDRVGDFLGGVARRLERGEAPSVALRDERVEWLRRGETWARDVVLFD